MIIQRPKMRSARPQEAMSLLLDKGLLTWHCDANNNPAFHNAKVTTKGPDGLTISDVFVPGDSVEKMVNEVLGVLERGPKGLRRALPLKAIEVPKKRPWVPGYDPEDRRVIYIPSARRRCISNSVAWMLSSIMMNRWPQAAIAYIPGTQEAVLNPVREVARAAREGNHWYVKLDIKDTFNQVPWRRLRRALRNLPLTKDAVDLVMALQQVRAFVSEKGHTKVQDRDRGVPAGLPEAGILLNILLKELDEALAECPGILAWRYSDDLVLVGRRRKDVLKAAKLWCHGIRALGMVVKEIQEAKVNELVKDIRTEPLVFLGVQIDHLGDLHMPQRVIDEKFAKLVYLRDQALKTEPVVVGFSKHADGRDSKGIDTADQEDLGEVIHGTYGYWASLNPAHAELFLRGAKTIASAEPYNLRRGPFEKIYAAILSRRTIDHSMQGCSRNDGSDLLVFQDLVQDLVIPLIGRCLGVEEASCDQSPVRDAGDKGTIWGARDLNQGTPEVLASMGSLGSDSYGEFFSPDESHPCGDGSSLAASRASEARDPAGAVPVESSAQDSTGCSAKTLIAFIGTENLLDGSCRVRTTLFEEDGVLSRLGSSSRIAQAEPAPLLVQAALDAVETAEGYRHLVVCVPPWLPKHLLREDRAFRSPGLFNVVRSLHRVATRQCEQGTDVVMIGVPEMRGLKNFRTRS